MKINSYTCHSAYDRPDYDKLASKSYGTRKTRVAIARQLILDGHTDCRALDNCFEMGDGDSVVAALIGEAIQNHQLRRAIGLQFPASGLTDGLPTTWLKTYITVLNPLQLAA
jgi:hypothetical protein